MTNNIQKPLTEEEVADYAPAMETMVAQMKKEGRDTVLLLGHEEILKSEVKIAGESLQTWERQEVMLFVHRGTQAEIDQLSLQLLGAANDD